MTNQDQPRIISLSAELARPEDDQRRKGAERWQAALHRLCLLRATLSETSYEIEWERIFDPRALMDNLKHPSKLLACAALDVLEVQHEHSLMVCESEGVTYDVNAMEEFGELLIAMREKIANDLP